MMKTEEIIAEAKKTIELAQKEAERRQLIKDAGNVVMSGLKPVLDNIAEQLKESIKQYIAGIKNIKIDVPKADYPEINIPEIKIPDIKIPEIKIDTLKFEQAITKAFKGLKFPETKVTVQERELPNEIGLKGWGASFKTLLETLGGLFRVKLEGVDTRNPLPVILTDEKGNAYKALMNVMSGGGRGGAVLIEGHSGLSEGTKTITTAGVRVQLSTESIACRRVFVQAHESNVDWVVAGGSGVIAASATRKGMALSPTQGEFFNVNNLNLIWLDAVSSGDKVNFYYET